MAQGVRVQLVLPQAVAEQLKAKAKAEGRTLSNLGSFLIEAALTQSYQWIPSIDVDNQVANT